VLFIICVRPFHNSIFIGICIFY